MRKKAFGEEVCDEPDGCGVEREGFAVQIGEMGVLREGEGDAIGAEGLEFIALRTVIFIDAVFAVPDERMCNRGEMRADLMRSACEQFDLQKAFLVMFGKHAVFRQDLLDVAISSLRAFGVDGNEVFVAILGEVAAKGIFLFRKTSVAGGKRAFVDLSFLDHLVQKPQGFGILGGNDDAAGVAVDAVTESGGKALLAVGVIFPFAIEIGFDMGDQGVLILVIVRMYQHSRAFVDQQNMLVLIHHRDVGCQNAKCLIGGCFFKKLILDEQLDLIPLGKKCMDLTAVTVELDFFGAHRFI